jgi:hypothetical protein
MRKNCSRLPYCARPGAVDVVRLARLTGTLTTNGAHARRRCARIPNCDSIPLLRDGGAGLRHAGPASESQVGECRSLRPAYAGYAAPRRCAGCACAEIRCSRAYGSRKSHRFHHRNRRAKRSGRREGRRGEDRNDAHLRYGGRADNGRVRLALRGWIGHHDDRRHPAARPCECDRSGAGTRVGEETVDAVVCPSVASSRKRISDEQNLQPTVRKAAENARRRCKKFTPL